MPSKFGNRYPWKEWFSKPRFVVVKGKDFECSMLGMAQMLRNQATKWKKSLTVVIDDERRRITVYPRSRKRIKK